MKKNNSNKNSHKKNENKQRKFAFQTINNNLKTNFLKIDLNNVKRVFEIQRMIQNSNGINIIDIKEFQLHWLVQLVSPISK